MGAIKMSVDKYKFQKLTPDKEIEIGIYCDALDFIFENDDVRNIALSGAYSAGKSSVLESYKTKHSNKKFLHISLAHFEENTKNNVRKKEDESTGEAGIKETVLEGKILNQLIHQVDAKNIPQTNFRIKHKLSNFRLILNAVSIIVFMIFAFHVIFFSTWVGLVENLSNYWVKSMLTMFTGIDSLLISGSICFAVMLCFIFYTIKLQVNKGIFKKFSADKVEIEIFEESDDSYFDKYLNEVLYLFDRSKADVIVFEDMDRYNAYRIFERLREVNTLINAQRQNRSLGAKIKKFCGLNKYIKKITGKIWRNKNKKSGKHKFENLRIYIRKITGKISKAYKPLRFLYLLKDDIFISKDRTKFFDYIIPVVPVVDSSNSYDQFIKHLKDGNVFELFDESFLQELSLYVDDMRILKNIYNEFMVYYNRLNTIELNPDKMLAIIAYKNLFPHDFSDLQLGKGFVCTLFKNRNDIIKSEVNNLVSQIEEIQGKISSSQNEHLESESEVDSVFKESLRNRYNTQAQITELQNEINERKENIKNKSEDRINEFNEKILILENKKIELYSSRMEQILTRENIDKIFSTLTFTNNVDPEVNFNEIKGNEYFALLKFLIRNGHIDETYTDYMTYFYENSLSSIDKIFLRSISDQIKKEYGYKLKEPRKVAERLSLVSFKKQEVLNFDLLFFLLESTENETKLNEFIKQLEQTKNYVFIEWVFSEFTDDRLNILVNKLNSKWDEFLISILVNTAFSEIYRDGIVLRTLYNTSDNVLIGTRLGDSLTNFISNKQDFLKIERPNIDKLISRFITLNVCFKSIDYESANKELFLAVYEKNLYELSFANISLMLRVMYKLEETEVFKHKSYTLIMSNLETPLSRYIHSQINDYITVIIEHCNERISDDEQFALNIINNADIFDENKTKYVSMLGTTIQNLSDVLDKELWVSFIKTKCIAYSERNILEYFIQVQYILTDELLDFMDSQDSVLDYTEIKEKYENVIQSKFFSAVVRCEEINNEHYRQILSSLNRVYSDSFAVKGIPDDKVLILIDIGIIKMYQNTLLFIRENYPNAVLSYIEKYIDSYVNEVLNDDNFSTIEAIEVLKLDVADEYKLELLHLINDELTANNPKYSDAVRAYILENNIDLSDIPHFISSYSTEGTLTKTIIESIVIEQIEVIFINKYNIDEKLVDKLLETDISHDDKMKLVALLLPDLEEKQCKSYFKKIKLNNYMKLFEKKRPLFKVDAVNERMLAILNEKNWITKFELEEKEGVNYYRAFGRSLSSDSNKTDDPAFLG